MVQMKCFTYGRQEPLLLTEHSFILSSETFFPNAFWLSREMNFCEYTGRDADAHRLANGCLSIHT